VHWLLLKETLMREDERAGGKLTRNQVKNMFRLEAVRATRLFDLAVAQQWIGTKGAQGGGVGDSAGQGAGPSKIT
jgi:hypothetical protein